MREIKISIPQSSLEDSLRPVDDNLKTINGYLVYSNVINSDLVNEFNVREFLDDDRNSDLSLKFFQYLKGNTNKKEFDNIVYDDKKLAEVLNEYYNTTVRTNTTPNINVIKENLTGTSIVSVKENTFSILNKRIDREHSFLTQTIQDDSFYLDVFLERKSSTITPITFNELVKTSVESDILYVQGFVDLNNVSNPFENLSSFLISLAEHRDEQKMIEKEKKEKEEKEKLEKEQKEKEEKENAEKATQGRG